MSDLLKTIRNTIDRHNLLPRGGKVVVGVSGGPDSLCLLHVLRALAPSTAYRSRWRISTTNCAKWMPMKMQRS